MQRDAREFPTALTVPAAKDGSLSGDDKDDADSGKITGVRYITYK